MKPESPLSLRRGLESRLPGFKPASAGSDVQCRYGLSVAAPRPEEPAEAGLNPGSRDSSPRPTGPRRQGRHFWPLALTSAFVLALLAPAAFPQDAPRISALFPAGGKAGETVDVTVKGGNLLGAKEVIVLGPGGVKGEIVGGNATVDQKAKPLFQAKCTTCHEARSPANRSLTPEQWAATVDRMINQRGADIAKPDRDTIVTYLQAMAKAGEVSTRFTIAPDAAPGIREVRIVTLNGATTAYSFEVGSVPETFAKEPNSSPETPQKITFPVVVNGVLAQGGERDFFSFDAKKGRRLVFNLKGYRLNEQSQAYFNPSLYLYDAKGTPLARSNGGRFGLDPVLDWTAPEDGTYTLLVRDLLYKGSPSSVYRLTAGALPYDAVLTPPAGRPGEKVSAHMAASLPVPADPVTVQVPNGVNGLTTVPTPMGDAPFLVRDLPDGGGPLTGPPASAPAVTLPALFKGTIAAAGRTDVFKVKTTKPGEGLELYARRLGSPLRAQVVVKNANGQPVGSQVADGNGDLRLEKVFTEPGEYTVEVTDADGKGGPQFAYAWESIGSGPDFTLTAMPDVVNLGPGARVGVLVRALRRERVSGPIAVSVKNLPPGVTARPAVIPPDDDKAVVLLEAAAGTAAGAASVVTIEGETAGEGDAAGVVRRTARPIEVYRVNNNPKLQTRDSQMVAVIPDTPPFTIQVDVGNTLALQQNEEVPVKVTVQRAEGFKGDLILGVVGTPPGINLRGEFYLPANLSERTILVRADGNARFLKERPRPDLPPMRLIFSARLPGMGDEQMITCAAPITLTAKPEPEKKEAGK